MVSLIQSNYRNFGSGMTPDGVGFRLQPRRNVQPGGKGNFNSMRRHKRPFHTIIRFHHQGGQNLHQFGVMGGGMQPQGHAQSSSTGRFSHELQEAGDAPRIQHVDSSEPTGEKMVEGGQVIWNLGFPRKRNRSHQTGPQIGKTGAGTFGGYQAIWYDAVTRCITALGIPKTGSGGILTEVERTAMKRICHVRGNAPSA